MFYFSVNVLLDWPYAEIVICCEQHLGLFMTCLECFMLLVSEMLMFVKLIHQIGMVFNCEKIYT